MILLGCRPKGRSIEQHDIFFGIGESLKDLIPAMNAFWPEAKGKIHIDAWREVNYVNGYKISISQSQNETLTDQLFFVNLGGYKPGEFEEFHYKMLVAGPDMATAVKASKQTAFYKHTGFKGATSHIDDKYGIDVDDVFVVYDLLGDQKNNCSIVVEPGYTDADDSMHLGYLKMDKVK